MIVTPLLSVYLFLPWFGSLGAPAEAPRPKPQVTVVVSDWKEEYGEALKGLRETLDAEVRVYDFKRSNERIPLVMGEIQRREPDLIITFGTSSYKIVKKRAGEIPLMFSMVSFPEKCIGENETSFGISLQPDPRAGMDFVRRAWGKHTRIGMIYDPRLSDDLVARQIRAAKEAGLLVKALPVKDDKESYRAINELKDWIDLFFLMPDSAIANKRVFDHLKLECFRRKKPMIACSRVYLARDCVASVGPDFEAIGRLTGEKAAEFLEKGRVPGVVYAEKAEICVNLKAAKRLEVDFPRSLLETVSIFKEGDE